MKTCPSGPPTNRRRFLQSAVLLSGAVLLAACGQTPAAAPATSAPAAAPATSAPAAATPTVPPAAGAKPAAALAGEVKFLARGDDPIFKVFRDERDAFQKDNPKVSITIDESPGDWYQKFQLQIASGTPPDAVFESAGTTTATARAGALQPLDDLMKSDKRFNKGDYWDIAFLPSLLGGKTYHMPYDGGSEALFYNKDLFAANSIKNLDPKNPITLDDLLTIAKQLTVDMSGKHPGDSGFDPTRMKQYGIDPATGSYWVYVYANGGEVLDDSAKKVRINEPAAVEGIQWLADLMAKQHVSPSPAFTQASPMTFATGSCAMQYGGVWDCVRQRQDKFDWDVAPFPKGKVKVSTGWYSGLAMLAASKVKDAAWQWIFFCTSTPGQTIIAGLGQDVPAVKALATTPTFLDPSTRPASKQVFLDEMDGKLLRLPGDTAGLPFGGYWREFGQVLGPLLDPIWRGAATAADKLKEAEPKLNLLLETGKVT
jgi:multiple sugar transport system substrate-binding protein